MTDSLEASSEQRTINDPLSIWDGEKLVFTLRKIKELTNGLFAYGDEYVAIEDEPIAVLDYQDAGVSVSTAGKSVIFLAEFNRARMSQYADKARKGVIVVTGIAIVDKDGKTVPCITMPSVAVVRNIWCAIGDYVKRAFPMPTICITGSIGKTTTTRFVEKVFSQSNKVFVSGRNRNTAPSIVQQLVKRFSPDFDFHIQEVGGGAPGVVERSAEILHADAFAITNVHAHHLAAYKTIEGVLYDKTSLDRVAKDSAFALINLDDEQLRSHEFATRCVTFAVHDESANYVARNIRQVGKWLTFDAVDNVRGGVVPLRINVPGVHNAYNGLVAFAFAREYGISDEDVQKGLESYRSTGYRQVIREVCGRTLYIDCFNCSRDSIRSCLTTLQGMEAPEGARKIAVLGGEGGLFELNYVTGLGLAEFDVDEFVFVGPAADSKPEEFAECGYAYAEYLGARRNIRFKPVSFMSSLLDVADFLQCKTKPGDVVLFKSSFHVALHAAIDIAFGTNYFHYDLNYPGRYYIEGPCKVVYYARTNGSNLMTYNPIGEHVVIPNFVRSKPLTRIGRRIFADHAEIKGIDFGKSVQTIGSEAFAGCTGVVELSLPASVQYVEERAFANCSNLKEVTFKGVEQIDAGAFAGCESLEIVRIPSTCVQIEPDAFAGCPHVVIEAPDNPYVQQLITAGGAGIFGEISVGD